jgi:glycine/D-amino acid oxidase-like deaminating enzyme
MFVGAGFNAFGIASGGGAGWVLAEWVIDRRSAARSLGRRYPPLFRDASRPAMGQ